MKNLLKITGFEYLTCIRNKAFIIITVITLAVILGSGFLPALISSFDSPDEDSEKTKTIAAFDSSHSFSDELIKAELSMYFPDADVVISDGDMSDVSDKVNSGDYQFAVEITSPLSFTYITKNNGLYETDTQILSMAVKGMYAGMLLGEYGIDLRGDDTGSNCSLNGAGSPYGWATTSGGAQVRKDIVQRICDKPLHSVGAVVRGRRDLHVQRSEPV